MALHGELPQDERNQITRQYRQHHIQLLIATEVAARGLDIAEIDQVINFDMARNLDDYLHRVCRTGRAGSAGLAINLVNISERKLLDNVEHAQGKPLSRLKIKGLAAKQHKDGEQAAKKPSKKSNPRKQTPTKAKNSKAKNSKAKKPSSVAAKAKAATIWGDGSAPFGLKKP